MGQIIRSVAAVFVSVGLSSLLRSQFWIEFVETLRSHLVLENRDRVRYGSNSNNAFPCFTLNFYQT